MTFDQANFQYRTRRKLKRPRRMPKRKQQTKLNSKKQMKQLQKQLTRDQMIIGARRTRRRKVRLSKK